MQKWTRNAERLQNFHVEKFTDSTKPSTSPTAVRMFKITAKMDQKIEDRIKHFDSGSPLSSARLPCNRLCVWGDMQLLQHKTS